MSAKLKPVFVFLMIAVLFTGISCNRDAQVKEETLVPIRLTVKQDENNVWKVVSSDGTSDIIKVHANQNIFWKVVGTDAYFQFPVQDKKVFHMPPESDPLTNGYTAVRSDGESLHLKIKGDPEKGPIVYAVFCMADSVFAIQGSPPLIVVQ